MLTIRKAQLEVLGNEARRDFERRLHRHLSGLSHAVGDALPQLVTDAIETTRSVRITRERDVALYCELAVRYRHTARLESWPKPAQNILLAHGVAADARLKKLKEWILAAEEKKSA